MEMLWPAFNELGDLPVGVYRATLAEVVAHLEPIPIGQTV
jgi:hypothetical protein